MKTFKILGLLLSYPEQEMVNHLEEMAAVLKEEDIIPPKLLKSLRPLIEELQKKDLIDLQEMYVETFDRGRAHCLHLFEHIHGESRDRGQAMVNLAEMYREKGFYIRPAELPDYLPLFLEYLSFCALGEAKELLGDAMSVIAVIGAKLQKRKNLYAPLFLALQAISEAKIDKKLLANAAMEKEDNSLEALDKEWEEAAAFSGSPEKECGTCNAFPNATAVIEKMAGGIR